MVCSVNKTGKQNDCKYRNENVRKKLNNWLQRQTELIFSKYSLGICVYIDLIILGKNTCQPYVLVLSTIRYFRWHVIRTSGNRTGRKNFWRIMWPIYNLQYTRTYEWHLLEKKAKRSYLSSIKHEKLLKNLKRPFEKSQNFFIRMKQVFCDFCSLNKTSADILWSLMAIAACLVRNFRLLTRSSFVPSMFIMQARVCMIVFVYSQKNQLHRQPAKQNFIKLYTCLADKK